MSLKTALTSAGARYFVVRRGIETFGGTGESLVKGVVITLSAIGLSVKPDGSAHVIEIDGGAKAAAGGS